MPTSGSDRGDRPWLLPEPRPAFVRFAALYWAPGSQRRTFRTIDRLEPPGSVSVSPSPHTCLPERVCITLAGPERKLTKNAHQNSWFGGRRWIPSMELRLPQLRRVPQRLFAHPAAVAIADRLLPPPRSLVPGRRLARPALSDSGHSGAIAPPGQSRPLSPRWRFSPLGRN